MLTPEQMTFRLASIVSVTYYVRLGLYLWIKIVAANMSQQDRDHHVGISLLCKYTAPSDT